MGNTIGVTFSPTDASNTDRRNGNNPSRAPQGPIQTINYQLPRVAGAASLSPLVSAGGGGTPFSSAVLNSILKTILGPDHESLMNGGGFSAGGSIGGGQGGGQDNGAAFLQSLAGQGARTSPPTYVHPGGFQPDDGQTGDSGGGGSERQPSSVAPSGDTTTPSGWLRNEQQLNAGAGGGQTVPNFGGTAAPGGGFGAIMRNKEDGLYSSPVFT